MGSVGYPRAAIVYTLARALPEDVTVRPVGLSDAHVRHLCSSLGLAATIRPLAVGVDLPECLWWGSALADLGVSAHCGPPHPEVLVEGGLYHLGFKLFDNVVDGMPSKRKALAAALHPDKLAARLRKPRSDETRLRGDDPVVASVVCVFDSALEMTGRRLEDSPTALDRLGQLLTGMYESELRITHDPFFAKTAPVLFQGSLPGGDLARAESYFRPLSAFLSMWDDWVDLAPDMLALAPNYFLGDPGTDAAQRARYAATCVTRLAFGGLRHGSIASSLVAAMDQTIQASAELGDMLLGKTVGVCQTLVSVEA